MTGESFEVNAGRLRNKITIQSQALTRDSVGGRVTTWSDVATVWAAVIPLGGNELQEAAILQSDMDTDIEIRYQPGIDPTMRVVDTASGEIYDIRAVRDVENRHRKIVLKCRKRAIEQT